MNEGAITVSGVVALVIIVSAGAAVFSYLLRAVRTAEDKMRTELREETLRLLEAIAALRHDLEAHQLQVAREFAPLQLVLRTEERFSVTADKLIARMDHLAEAVNRLVGKWDGGPVVGVNLSRGASGG